MAQTWDPLRDMPSLGGRVALVTGGKYVRNGPFYSLL